MNSKFQKFPIRSWKNVAMGKLFKSRRGPKARGGTSNKKTKKFFDLVSHYFFRFNDQKYFFIWSVTIFSGWDTFFGEKCSAPKVTTRARKNFFVWSGTIFSGPNTFFCKKHRAPKVTTRAQRIFFIGSVTIFRGRDRFFLQKNVAPISHY